MTTYIQDSEGKFIPASQRPDGTWRKARRVKDGYVPQEEVPLYESKGKLFAKKPTLPPGMCPQVVAATRKANSHHSSSNNNNTISSSSSITTHQPIPGLTITTKTGGKAKKEATEKKANPTAASNKNNNNNNSNQKQSKPSSSNNNSSNQSSALSELVDRLSLTGDEGTDAEKLAKLLKKLRKKIREIDNIVEKIRTGEIKQPDKDQLDKVGRRKQILKEIEKLEKHPLILAATPT